MSSVGIAVQISKFIPLLASDRPGEVVAAVNAMDRALRREGRDFHDLAAAVERGWSLPCQQRRSPDALHWWQRQARNLLALGVTSKQRRWLDAIATAMGVTA